MIDSKWAYAELFVDKAGRLGGFVALKSPAVAQAARAFLGYGAVRGRRLVVGERDLQHFVSWLPGEDGPEVGEALDEYLRTESRLDKAVARGRVMALYERSQAQG